MMLLSLMYSGTPVHRYYTIHDYCFHQISLFKDGDTALMIACANGSVEIVNSLIGVGADPSYQNAQVMLYM